MQRFLRAGRAVRLAAAAIAVVVLTGCGGLGHNPNPNPFYGYYHGRYFVTFGPDFGSNESVTLTVDTWGNADITILDSKDESHRFEGKVNETTGKFRLTGYGGEAEGTLSASGKGSGTFEIYFDNHGTLDFDDRDRSKAIVHSPTPTAAPHQSTP